MSKDEAKAIRKLNKQKNRPENKGLVAAGIGRAGLPEYYVLNFCDRNISKDINIFKNIQRDNSDWQRMKNQIEKTLSIGLRNLNTDINNLDILIDSYNCIFLKTEKIVKILREFERQLISRKMSIEEYKDCKIIYDNIVNNM